MIFFEIEILSIFRTSSLIGTIGPKWRRKIIFRNSLIA